MRKTTFFLTLLLTLLPFTLTAQRHYAGGDISLLPSYEQSGTHYLDAQGQVIPDLIPWLMQQCGWNSFRVRLFVDPQGKNNTGGKDPSVCQTLEYVTALGQRIKSVGGQFMLDFHYSDTWVDALHIQSPAAWKGLSASEKAEKIYSYTRQSLQTLCDAGAQPDLVQVGNEIMYGLCDIAVHPYQQSGDQWDAYLALLRGACQAVREVCPQAGIIVHTDRATNQPYNKFYYQKLVDGGVDFDIIGLSFYPFWHGYLSANAAQNNKGLSAALDQLAVDFPDKRVQIVETAYNFQYWPSEGVTYDTRSTWACSEAGQHQFVRDLVAELQQHPNVDGIFYWCPEEAGNGDQANWSTYEGVVISSWLNRGLWDSTASGAGHRAHAQSGVLTASLLGDYGTAVPSISADRPVPSALYNVMGQRVSPTTRGFVIKHGKVILCK